MRRHRNSCSQPASNAAWLAQWQTGLLTRRRFLLGLAGGTLLALFPFPAASAPNTAVRWRIIDAVQQHLFPSEPDAPGAREIKALDYLKRIAADRMQDADKRDFILQGAGWLEDMSRRITRKSFLLIDAAQREQVLRRIEASEAGSNWLAQMLLYLIEALLADPVYGGNPQGIGWRWLAHTPGFPTPPPGKRYMELRR